MASSRATVVLPLPLSPTRATISRSWMTRFRSSTAWSIRRESNPPRRKCLVRPVVRRRASSLSGAAFAGWLMASDRVAELFRIEEAANLRVAHCIQGRLCCRALRHRLTAATMEAASGGGAPEVGRAAGDAAQRPARAADRWERVEEAPAVRVQRTLEDRAGIADLGHLPRVHDHHPVGVVGDD